MILNLEHKEIAALSYHMLIMRKNVRKGFKSNYGKEAKEKLASYDEVKNTVVNELDRMADQPEQHDFNFNIREIEMLLSFLVFYIDQLKKTLEEANVVGQEDWDQVDYLSAIKGKVEDLRR